MDNIGARDSVVAIFRDRESADHARDELLRSGFDSNQVHVTSSDELAQYVGSGNTGLSGHHYDSSGGGITGFFHRLFGDHSSDEDRAYYSEATQPGRCAVVVETTDEYIDRASDILDRNGAVDVQDHTEDTSHKFSTEKGKDERTSIPVVDEQLQVGKRTVRRGGVRVYSNVQEHPVEKTVNLREEHVRVDRRPADRPATDADLAAAKRGVIEVNETVEEPVVEKTARVVEDVVISKDVRERQQTVRDTVRRNDVKVEGAERSGRTDTQKVVRDDYDTDFRNDFRTRYGGNARYEDYQPAYRYGYDMASDARYRGRSFDEVENDLRADYTRRYPNSTWDRMKDSIRYGWDKVTGKR